MGKRKELSKFSNIELVFELRERVVGGYGKPFTDEELEKMRVDDELSDVFDGEGSNG